MRLTVMLSRLYVLTYGDKVYTWERGRVLKSITEGENTYSFAYDEDGLRTRKTANGVTTYYNYVDGQLVSQKSSNENYPIIFEYNTDGQPVGFVYRNIHYYYLTNQMGDVIGITDTSGNQIALYHYDEWGNLLSIETATEGNATQLAVANANPLRYRGYYYDSETGYYYLQSRYYDPNICRFINADVPEFLGIGESLAKWNLFSYCENEPVNSVDSEGFVSLKGIFKKITSFINFTRKGIIIRLNAAMSVIVGGLALIYRICNIVSDIKNIHKLTGKKMATAIVTALPYGTANISAEVIALLCNVGAAVAALSVVVSFIATCCTGGIGAVAITVFKFIIGYIVPSIVMAVQMIYYGCWKKKGCTYTIKLLGGASVSFK